MLWIKVWLSRLETLLIKLKSAEYGLDFIFKMQDDVEEEYAEKMKKFFMECLETDKHSKEKYKVKDKREFERKKEWW